MERPLVSCIMPTYNRREFVPHAIEYFLRQGYDNKELIIVDDGTDKIKDLVPDEPSIRYFYLDKKITLGAKLNLACRYAIGNIIANWDDDDWYAPTRLQYQITALQESKTDVCGINNLLYYDLRRKKAFQYIYPANQRTWLLGSSLCYTKKLWYSNQFADIDVGMDGLFVWATSADRVKTLTDNSFSVHMIHDRNVSPKKTDSGWWHTYPVEEIKKIMRNDWWSYADIGSNASWQNSGMVNRTSLPFIKKKKIQNVHACLVHESRECIADLVRNLHYHDPESVILLYNGSNDPNLLATVDLDFSEFNAIVVPDAVPAKHGYLHHFALHCMQFALKHLFFDTITIVDSDQVAIRSGYTDYLSDFFSHRANIGLLSSMPQKVLPDDKVHSVAVQAFREFELWKPFVQTFPDWENKFVHWTFWPSTVFTYNAVRDLVNLFRENKQLQSIMQQTKIWATEEVIFPTLIRLLGYDIVANPCSYDYVKYRRSYTSQEVNAAMNKQDAFWMHPVERKYADPLRRYTRQRFNQYKTIDKTVVANNGKTQDVSAKYLIPKIKKIEGWLSDMEAFLLIDITKRMFKNLPSPHTIVEVGGYHGKSTVLFGSMAKSFFPNAKVYAIDPHDCKQGAADKGLQIFPSSWEPFNRNMEIYELQDVVEIIRDKAENVIWQTPVAFLFIDGLHDYENVSKDFNHFKNWIITGGYVGFHDYADYFPGVIAFVDELLFSGLYQNIMTIESLFVLQRIK